MCRVFLFSKKRYESNCSASKLSVQLAIVAGASTAYALTILHLSHLVKYLTSLAFQANYKQPGVTQMNLFVVTSEAEADVGEISL